MNRDSQRLLSEILAEADEAGERRQALLDRTLRHVRYRRTVRRVRRVGPILLLLLLSVVLVWRAHLPQVTAPGNHPTSYFLVRTAPLPTSAVVETRPLTPSGLVSSAPSLKLATIFTRPDEHGYREIDDATLLALAGTNAVVLVRLGPHSAELVFASENMTAHGTD